jgi:hypothetical protein
MGICGDLVRDQRRDVRCPRCKQSGRVRDAVLQSPNRAANFMREDTRPCGVDVRLDGSHAEVVARRARLRLLGEGWISYGGATLPDDRIIEVSAEEAAAFLRHRGSARRVEFLEWIPGVPDSGDEDDQPDRS